MDGLKPRRSAVSRVGNYSEFNSFGFDNLEHLKDRYYSTAPVAGMASVELNGDPEVVLKTREAMEGDKVGHEAQECEVVGGDSAMGSVEGIILSCKVNGWKCYKAPAQVAWFLT